MAIGYPPEYAEDYAAHNLKTAQKVALVHLALEKKAWEVTHLGTQSIIAGTSHGFEDWIAVVTIRLNEQSITIASESGVEENNDQGKNRKVVYALMETLNHLKDQYSPDDLVAHYNTISHEVIEDALPQKEVNEEPAIPETTQEKINGYITLFKPSQGYFATPIIAWINILIFIVMVVSGVHFMNPSTTDLVNWGANFSPTTLDGEPWRLFTSTFLHIGILHLLMNMYALVYIGTLLEPLIGTKRFIVAYLLTGILASTASLIWHDFAVSAGASGAIFGMYGLFLALLSVNIIAKEARKPLLASIGIFVLFNLANGMKAGIDNAAHIGGLISGLVIGYLYILSLKTPANKQKYMATLIVPAIVTLVIAYAVYNNKPNDIGTYQEMIEEFSALEKEALEVYNLPEGATEADYQIGIANGIRKWQECSVLLDSMKDLDLPDHLKGELLLLKEYCSVRSVTYLTQGKYLNDPTPDYLLEIKDLGQKTDSLLLLINN